MLPYQELEYCILQHVIGRSGNRWTDTTLPQLAGAVNAGWEEAIAALRRLHVHGRLELRKYLTSYGYYAFTGKESDGEFFHQAGFQLKIAPEGRAHFDELQELKRKESVVSATDREFEQKFRILFSAAQARVDFAEWTSDTKRNAPVAILFVDIDNFKGLNSDHTETVIDETLLPQFQRLLQTAVKHRGYAYRQGGEEFLIALPNHTAQEAATFAERLRADTENEVFRIRSQEIHLTISVGVASFPYDGSTFDDVVRAANRAENQAKAARRNCVVVAGLPGLDQATG